MDIIFMSSMLLYVGGLVMIDVLQVAVKKDLAKFGAFHWAFASLYLKSGIQGACL